AKIALGDIIYCLRGSVGNCAINKEATEGTVASSLVDIRPTKIHPEYLNYILQSPINSVQTLAYMNGSCAANLSAENVANYYFIEPPVTKQRIISAFLDSKCSEIDSIISDIQSQIEALEEYKRSVITEAVTKGLDPDVEMRDSGIDYRIYPLLGKQEKENTSLFKGRKEV
ncbi:MAG: restriction endonuclease subunit S, partial [Ruminococcus bicirculans (ex Wegman et al. 2014)]